MLRQWGLCGIRWSEDKGCVVREAFRVRVLLGVRTKASLLERSGGLHLGNVTIRVCG